MKLSKLQKFILLECLGRKGKFKRQTLLRFYDKQKQPAKKEDQQKIISQSLERLIDKELMIGFGRRTPHKWFIEEIKLTAKGKRKAFTEYKVLKNFKNYALIKVLIKTGRKHQIRCHLSYLGHPIAGDKLYGFKNQPCPKGLDRHFLHADYLKIELPKGGKKEFKSELPEDLKKVLDIIFFLKNHVDRKKFLSESDLLRDRLSARGFEVGDIKIRTYIEEEYGDTLSGINLKV